MLFLGWISACLILPSLANTYGRKVFVIGVCGLQAILYSILIFIPHQALYYLIIFMFGISIPMKGIVSYTHLMEFLPGKVSSFSCILLFFDGMVLTMSPLILRFISQNTNILLYIPLVINVVSLIIFAIFYIPESTKHLLDKRNYE